MLISEKYFVSFNTKRKQVGSFYTFLSGSSRCSVCEHVNKFAKLPWQDYTRRGWAEMLTQQLRYPIERIVCELWSNLHSHALAHNLALETHNSSELLIVDSTQCPC